MLVRGVVKPNIVFSSQEAVLGNFIVLSKHGDTVRVTAGKWRWCDDFSSYFLAIRSRGQQHLL